MIGHAIYFQKMLFEMNDPSSLYCVLTYWILKHHLKLMKATPHYSMYLFFWCKLHRNTYLTIFLIELVLVQFIQKKSIHMHVILFADS